MESFEEIENRQTIQGKVTEETKPDIEMRDLECKLPDDAGEHDRPSDQAENDAPTSGTGNDGPMPVCDSQIMYLLNAVAAFDPPAHGTAESPATVRETQEPAIAEDWKS